MLEVWRLSDYNQLSRLITLQKCTACSVVFLPYQCKTQSTDARQNGREELPQDPKSHLQIAIVHVMVPAREPAPSWGWVLSRGANFSKSLIAIGQERTQGDMEDERKSCVVGEVLSHRAAGGCVEADA